MQCLLAGDRASTDVDDRSGLRESVLRAAVTGGDDALDDRGRKPRQFQPAKVEWRSDPLCKRSSHRPIPTEDKLALWVERVVQVEHHGAAKRHYRDSD